MTDTTRDKLIVALDLPDATKARAAIERLGDSVKFYKIGMELAYGGGFGLVDELARAGKQVFRRTAVISHPSR